MNLDSTPVTIELDCKLASLQGYVEYIESLCFIIYCKTIMHSLPKFRIGFIKRQTNNVFHLLAQAN